MKVQIFEQFCGGHYTNYIQYLLPDLMELKKEKIIDEIIVSITPEHIQSTSFQQKLKNYSNGVDFDASLLEVNSNLTFNPKAIISNPSLALSSIKKRKDILLNASNSILRIQPDHFISTTADILNPILAIKGFFNAKTFPDNLYSTGIVHYGYAGSVNDWNDWVKDFIYRFTWRYSSWSRLLMVNPFLYESLKKDTKLSEKLELVPDPVPSYKLFDVQAARKYLKIPLDGRYLGFVGNMDHRKAIPELLLAFKKAISKSSDRLLLAGKLLPRYKLLIQQEYKDLLDSGRIILLDRYLTDEELMAGFCALDIATILLYRLPTLSGNFLKAIAMHKPVVADNFGYTGYILKNFPVGWHCDINEPENVVTALRKALEQFSDYHVTESVSRLIEFHAPENYAASVLKMLYKQSGYPSSSKTWEWVLGSTPSNTESI